MISVQLDLMLLAKALAPLLASELRAVAATSDQNSCMPGIVGQMIGGVGQSSDSAVPLRSPDSIVDGRGAREFGLSLCRFNTLARSGAFPTFRIDGRGKLGAYRRDIQAWVDEQMRQGPPPLRMREPRRAGKPSGIPNSPEVDAVILKTLEKGRLRFLPAGAGQARVKSIPTNKPEE